jgi:hypothetical protein
VQNLPNKYALIANFPRLFSSEITMYFEKESQDHDIILSISG